MFRTEMRKYVSWDISFSDRILGPYWPPSDGGAVCHGEGLYDTSDQEMHLPRQIHSEIKGSRHQHIESKQKPFIPHLAKCHTFSFSPPVFLPQACLALSLAVKIKVHGYLHSITITSINAKKIIRKKSLKKFRLAGIWILTSMRLLRHFNRRNWQATWELVIKLGHNIPGKSEEGMINSWVSYVMK